MRLRLHVWRQPSRGSAGKLVDYVVDGVSEHASFLEMLDLLNEQLIGKGQEPVAFDHDCREGICGMCSLMINGRPHGGNKATTTCQLHMRHFTDGQEIWIEPWRAHAFPVVKDLCVDRSAFDHVIAAGGFITANVGSAPDANSVPIAKESRMHRLRRVRRRVPERFGDAVRRGEARAPASPAAGPARARPPQ
jgi:succinate dehydrogenase / fumarate reductase iron-sulfur subunit